jgi:hypothetical protein
MMTREDRLLLLFPHKFRAEVTSTSAGDGEVNLDARLKSQRVRMGVELM